MPPTTMPTILRSLRHLPRLPHARADHRSHCSRGGVSPDANNRPAATNQWLATAGGSLWPRRPEAAATPLMMPATGASARVCERGGRGVFSRSEAASGQLGGGRQAAQKQCAEVRQMQGNSWRRAHGRQGGNGGRTYMRGSCRACPN